MSVSPGVAGLDRLRSSGLYLGGVGLNPPTSPWSFLSWPEDRRAPFWRMDGRESLLSCSRQYLVWDGGDEQVRSPLNIDLTHDRSFVRTCPARVRTVIDKCGQATKGAGWMSWHREATKDVVACDKPREAGKQALIRGCLNEETRRGNPPSPAAEFIGVRSEPRELKHLSTWRKRKRHRFRQ